MIDMDFGDMSFGRKWRSSLAVYFYIVPEEEIADSYPNSRIVYLKLTCSITGWNPSEELRDVESRVSEAGPRDDLQRTLWETIIASGWAQKYWECRGAIMQISIYPNPSAGVAPDDYPYFIDFEPKKRELYESVTEGRESLSGSAGKTSITSGSTSVTSTEMGAKVSGGFGPIGASASISRETSDTTVNQNITDTSREARETLSRTTSTSQMYQLFNGYHLGSNRALFVVAPRPNTVSDSSQTEFNLIEGGRKLEGIQEVFLVVHMPKSLGGFCVQAGLDTGHEAEQSVPAHIFKQIEDGTPDPEEKVDPPDPDPTPPDTPVRQLVVTRRIVQSCGSFDENGDFQLTRISEPQRPGDVVGEFALPDIRSAIALKLSDGTGGEEQSRRVTADLLNRRLSRVNRLMLDSASSVAYRPRPFAETRAFRALAAAAAGRIDAPIDDLVEKGHLGSEVARHLARARVRTVADLFRRDGSGDAEIGAARSAVVNRLLGLPERPDEG